MFEIDSHSSWIFDKKSSGRLDIFLTIKQLRPCAKQEMKRSIYTKMRTSQINCTFMEDSISITYFEYLFLDLFSQ
jgi:hypothetical protein